MSSAAQGQCGFQWRRGGWLLTCSLPKGHGDLHIADGGDAGQEVYVPKQPDMVNHPPHYADHPSGVECITVTEHMSFLRGNAVKYLWRAGAKGGPGKELEDLRKARFYLDREISNLEAKQ